METSGRERERERGSQVLLNGMLAQDRLLDLVENFILFDTSKPGATRKVLARNHQVLGVNNAVDSVWRQEELKENFPPEKRLTYRVIELPMEEAEDGRPRPCPGRSRTRKHKQLLHLVESRSS